MNDFQLTIKEGAITTNLEALKKELTEIAERHKGVIVTEDTVPMAKKDLADLRRTAKEIDDRRKTVKKQWNAPYTAFENEVKAALEIINEPIELIDKQVKDFEAQRKADKEQHVRDIYAEQIQGLDEYLPFADIFDEKWLNASTKDNDIIFDINSAVNQVKMDLEAIKALGSEFEEECIKAYKQSGNQLTAAIQRNTQLISAKELAEKKAQEEAQAKIEAEKRAREEAERRQAEAEQKAAEAEQKQAEAEQKLEEAKEEAIPEALPFDEDKATFTIYGADNLLKVRLFLMENEIRYEEAY
ncbi:MAG: DUF1351 domain-containing protein [Lachnospiraceae bacterium]|nr:DUF1351 domain-containing protein [Lachnospiraceae bacterium]